MIDTSAWPPEYRDAYEALRAKASPEQRAAFDAEAAQLVQAAQAGDLASVLAVAARWGAADIVEGYWPLLGSDGDV